MTDLDLTRYSVVRGSSGAVYARTHGTSWYEVDTDVRGGDEWVQRDAPIIPILDRDGQPVITRVGQLTAEHIGRTVRIDSESGALVAMDRGSTSGTVRIIWGCTSWVDCPLDTPCEVLS